MFKKVELDAGVFGNETYKASAIVQYGATLVRTGAGTAAGTKATGETNILGIVVDDEVQQSPYDGFYAVGARLNTIVGGKARMMVVANGHNTNIDAGDYLEVADLGSGVQAGRHGLLEEAGSSAGETRTAASIARALADVTMGSGTYKVPASDVAVGDVHIHLAAADITAMGLVGGDYILMEDITGDLMINKITHDGVHTDYIDLVMPSLVVLTATDSDLVTKIFQVPAILL